jgi:hypothetical protein
MTIDEFKQLRIGDYLQYPGFPAMKIIYTEHDYDYLTKPATSHTWYIIVEDGRSLRLSDPPEWIANTTIIVQEKFDENSVAS